MPGERISSLLNRWLRPGGWRHILLVLIYHTWGGGLNHIVVLWVGSVSSVLYAVAHSVFYAANLHQSYFHRFSSRKKDWGRKGNEVQSHLAIPDGKIKRICPGQWIIRDNRLGFGAKKFRIQGISSGTAGHPVEWGPGQARCDCTWSLGSVTHRWVGVFLTIVVYAIIDA